MVDIKSPPTRAHSNTRKKQGSMVSRAGQSIIASMLRRADIQSVELNDASADELNIEAVEIGPSNVEALTIADIQTLVSTGRVSLDDVISTVRLAISVDWRVNLLLDTVTGSRSVGSFSFDFNVGDIDIPGLDNLDISIPAATASETSANVQPITNLSFNGGQVDDIEIMDIRLPTRGYGIDGIGFDSFTLSHLGIPDASIGRISIGSLQPNGQLTIPSAEIHDIGVANVQVPTVRSLQAVNVPGIQTDPRGITLVNIGLLRVRVVITPTLDMNIAGLTLDDMEASSTISSVKLDNISFPLCVKGIELSDVNVGGLRAEQISL